MNKILKYIRADEWVTSKLSFTLAILLFFIYLNSIDLRTAIISFFVYFLYVSMFLAINYVANDFKDIDVDIKAGKKKIIANLSKSKVYLSLIIMFSLGNIPLLFLVKEKFKAFILIIISYFLGLAYSGLGFRFKEKGLWGLIECSFAQRSVVLLMLMFLFKMDFISYFYLFLWIVFSFLDGLRYIIIHQIVDFDNDLKSGVKTYINQKSKNYRNIVKIISIFLCVFLLLLLSKIIKACSFLMVASIIIYAIFEYAIYVVLNIYAKKDWLRNFDSLPLEGYINIVLPLILGIILSKTLGKEMIFLTIFIFCLCIKSFIIKVNLANIYFKSKIDYFCSNFIKAKGKN